jgi:5-(carboxyamino)imidazole ribonucleotide mutase
MDGLSPLVGVVMGSRSDWETMRQATEILRQLGIPYEARVVSAHRTPDLLAQYAKTARSRGLRLMLAAFGPVPVLGVPVQSKALSGVDSLYSIAQMPKGIPVATFAIGPAGAANAALFAAAVLAHDLPSVREALDDFRLRQTQAVLDDAPLEGN